VKGDREQELTPRIYRLISDITITLVGDCVS
jgi:hypothetical protein